MKRVARFAMILALAGGAYAWADGISCEGLTKLNLANTEITSATLVAAGAFTQPPNPNAPPPAPARAAGAPAGPPPEMGAQQARQAAVYKSLPAFCRVQATLRPSADSLIKIEVWLPAAGWNGRLAEGGNGGFSSNIPYGDLAQGLLKGYVTTGSDTGHQGNDSGFAFGHPEKVVDWGYRAVHETTVAAKAIVAAHYGSGPKYSYFSACSTGGRQGWVSAEYYPNDFDGLVIGDPANPMTRLQAGGFWASLALNKDEASFITQDKWNMIHKAVLDECDAKDGLKDGLVTDWRVCKFNPDTLLCKNGDAADCLTAPQIEALRKVDAGAKNPRTGEPVYPGYPMGIAMLPGPVAGKGHPDQNGIITYQALFQDPNWDYHTVNLDTDVARAEKTGNKIMNAVEPEKLSQVFAHGGKILLYHGWNDPAITPLISIELYEQAVKANGGLNKTYNDMRLFMIPGMNHCGGGEGPNTFDKLDVISAWVEKATAPSQIVASHSGADGKVDRTRPLCPYPQVAKYKGTGSIDDAANFACAKP